MPNAARLGDRLRSYRATGRSCTPPTISSTTAIGFASSASRCSGRTERCRRSAYDEDDQVVAVSRLLANGADAALRATGGVPNFSRPQGLPTAIVPTSLGDQLLPCGQKPRPGPLVSPNLGVPVSDDTPTTCRHALIGQRGEKRMLSDASHLVKDRSRSRSLRRSGTRSEGDVCRGTAYADQHAAFDVTAISQKINRAIHAVDKATQAHSGG